MKLAILDDYQNVALGLAEWNRLPSNIAVTVFDRHLGKEDDVAAALADFDILVIMRERTPFPGTLLRRLPKLKLLVTTGARNLSIDLAAAAEMGVTVCGTQSSGDPTAELIWALILATIRRIPQQDAIVRSGGWQTAIGSNAAASLGTGLKGNTLGLIGLGRLGSGAARIGQAFGMKVIAWSQNLTPKRAAEVGATYVTKEELLRQADIVSIHVVHSPRTRGLIGAAEFALMKPTAYLINTSRGPIVNEGALLAALNEGRIAGAGIDVYDQEPLPSDHPLRRAPNTVLTPHIGYVTEENYRQFYGDALEDVEAFLKGAPVRVISPA